MPDPDSRQSFRVLPALGWALTWGFGAGLGVAGGAWLTVVGEAGAPGVEALDPGSDLVTLPLLALFVVAAGHFIAQAVIATVRGLAAARRSEAVGRSD